MLNNETISKLNEMHMGTMASGFAAQLADPLRNSKAVWVLPVVQTLVNATPCLKRFMVLHRA